MPRDLWSVYIGTHDGQPIAALLVFYFNGTAEYFTPVIISEHRNTQALALVIYEAMKDAVSLKKCKYWNWGGTWLSQRGVYDFKKRWGTSDYPYYYYTKLFNEGVRFSSKEALLKNYPGFFVLPFSELEDNENE
jgi:lipid II:glycine glycyltransferase (peptidoglycan interpeptide bridge formation enzyme)